MTRRTFGVGVAFILLLLLALWLGREVVLLRVGEALVRDDVVEPGAAAIFLLMGDATSGRAEKAYELYAAGYAPRIVLAEERTFGYGSKLLVPTDASLAADFLKSKGVDPHDIIVLRDCHTTSTVDEARCFRKFLTDHPPRVPRVIVVTAWFHSSRAAWLFERIFHGSGIEIAVKPAPLWETTFANWWRHEISVLVVFQEYLKWTYWLVKQPA